MSEQLGCEIDNTEIIPTQEDLLNKKLKEKILNKLNNVIKNLTSVNYKKNYDYFKSLDSEKINILNNLSDSEFKVIQELLMTKGNDNEKFFSNLQIIQENNINFNPKYMFKILLKKINEKNIYLNLKHIKIIKNNLNFYFSFLKGEKNNGRDNPLNINKIIEIVTLFDKYNILLPQNLLNNNFIIKDVDKLEEVLQKVIKYKIINKSVFIHYLTGIDFNIDENFLNNYNKHNGKEIIDYFLKHNFYLLPSAVGGKLVKTTKNKLNNTKLKIKLDNFLNTNTDITYYTISNKNIKGRIAFSLKQKAFLPESLKESLLKMKKLGLVKTLNIETYKNIILLNELTHNNLEKQLGFYKSPISLNKGLDNINSGISYKPKNNLEIHEFLSDNGSLLVSNKFSELIISNLIYDNKLNFNGGKINFTESPKAFPGYEYTYRFMMNLLNTLIGKNNSLNIKGLKGKTNKEQFDYIINNLREEDFDYIQKEYLKQGKILIEAIKNLNLKEKK